jgi:RNA polymerase-interacting CarD/CdnL/TRCF family regulator
MHFTIGDTVVHPTYGIGKVVEIEEIKYHDTVAHPFYKISVENATIWVQVSDAGEARLRPLTPRHELDRYRKVLSDDPTPLNDDRYKRYAEYHDRLKSPSFKVWCEVVRDLTAHGSQKQLNENDSSTLRRVTDILAREWALSAGISPEDAAQEIKSILTSVKRAASF